MILVPFFASLATVEKATYISDIEVDDPFNQLLKRNRFDTAYTLSLLERSLTVKQPYPFSRTPVLAVDEEADR